MSKIKRIIISLLVVLSCTSFVFASNINMNLATQNETNEITQNVVNGTSVETNTNVLTNDISNNLVNNASNSVAANSITSSNSSNIEADIQSVNNINDIGSSTIELGQILNIFLIAVGFILILLAIAILIRTKK